MATYGCATTSIRARPGADRPGGFRGSRGAGAGEILHDHRDKFFDIIDGGRSHHVVMDRPHIRFNGAELVEDPAKLGACAKRRTGLFRLVLLPTGARRRLRRGLRAVGDVRALFRAHRIWRDADSGHWEERAKDRSLEHRLHRRRTDGNARDWRTARRIEHRRGGGGLTTPGSIACSAKANGARSNPALRMPSGRADVRNDDTTAALLFLVYPLDVVSPDMRSGICDDVSQTCKATTACAAISAIPIGRRTTSRSSTGKLWTGDFSLRLSERDKLAKARRGGAMVPVRSDIVRDRGPSIFADRGGGRSAEADFPFQPCVGPTHRPGLSRRRAALPGGLLSRRWTIRSQRSRPAVVDASELAHGVRRHEGDGQGGLKLDLSHARAVASIATSTPGMSAPKRAIARAGLGPEKKSA